MSLKQFISNYASYNEWANNKLVDWLLQVDKNALYTPVDSSFKSIDYTLQHILRTQKYWLHFITDKDTANFNWAVREGEVEKILYELKEVSGEMKSVFASFTDQEISAILNLDTPWAKNNLSRYEYIVHVINHSTYHRGQIITIARSLGITEGIVNTDYNMYNSL